MSKMNFTSACNLKIALTLGLLALASTCRAQTPPLTAGEAVLLPGTQGKFDFIRMDAAAGRLLLGHAGNKSFDVFHINSRLLKAVPTGTAQDAVADVKNKRYYVSGNDPGRMVIVDAVTLAVTGEVPTPAATDLIAFNPVTGMVYEDNDAAGEVWVIDPVAKKIVNTIKVDGSGVEDLAFDPEYKRLYQAVKGKSTIAVIDPTTNQVLETWPCAPAKGPHGIAVAPDCNGLLVACAEKLLLLDRTSGKVTATAAIAKGVDEMAYDPGLHIAYCASRQGKISAVAVEVGKLTALGDVPDEQGTGNITVDPKTHTVWIAYKKGTECFVQPFMPAK